MYTHNTIIIITRKPATARTARARGGETERAAASAEVKGVSKNS